MWRVLAALFIVTDARNVGPECNGDECDVYPDTHVSLMESETFEEESGIYLLQRKAVYTSQTSKKCKKRCRHHPKHDCRVICRISCVRGKNVTSPICKNSESIQSTTTSESSNAFSKDDPPTPTDTCQIASTLKTTMETLTENTLGMDVDSPRLHFKDVVELSEVLKDKGEYKNRKFDLIVEDASQMPMYKQNAEKNIVSAIMEKTGGLTKFVKDTKDLTGAYLGTVRIGIENAGSYVFRFTIVDADTGEPAALPLFPLTLFDVDGKGEIVSTCDAASVISVNSKLEEVTDEACFVHHSTGKEVNLPDDFEKLWPAQRGAAVTYVYANKASWDVQLHLDPSTPQRYFIMKSSNVLACSDDVESGAEYKGKNPGQKKKADT